MMSTPSWQERLYPHTHSGFALETFVRSWPVYDCAFDDEDRKVLRLIRCDEWERVAKAVRSELRDNLAIGRRGAPRDRDVGIRLFHPVRRIMRPKRVMQFNRQAHGPGITL